MTNRMLIGTALLAIATPPAFAQAPKPGANTNITRAQVVAELNAAFARVDTNKDGTISVAEANAAQQRVAAEQAAAIAQSVASEFAQLDKDKNGQLSLAEFKAGSPPVRVTPGQQVLNLLDANKDGKVTPAEFQAQRLGQFDRVDTNHDGTVTALERQAASQVR